MYRTAVPTAMNSRCSPPSPWWRQFAHDGRLLAAHMVNGIVIAEDALIAEAVGPHLARALGQIVSRYGATVIPNINAAIEVLGTGTDYRF